MKYLPAIFRGNSSGFRVICGEDFDQKNGNTRRVDWNRLSDTKMLACNGDL